jgi:hypothetical protein
MTRNVGSIDRAVRVVLGLALLSAAYLLDGPTRWLGLIGLVPLLTAVASVCPLYTVLGISTCRAASVRASACIPCQKSRFQWCAAPIVNRVRRGSSRLTPLIPTCRPQVVRSGRAIFQKASAARPPAAIATTIRKASSGPN